MKPSGSFLPQPPTARLPNSNLGVWETSLEWRVQVAMMTVAVVMMVVVVVG